MTAVKTETVIMTAVLLILYSFVCSGAESDDAGTVGMPKFTEIPMGDTANFYSFVSMMDIDNDGYAEILSGAGQSAPTIQEQTGIYMWKWNGSGWFRNTITPWGYYGAVKFAEVTGDDVVDIVAAAESQYSNGNISGLMLFCGYKNGTAVSFREMSSPYLAFGHNLSTSMRLSADGVAIGDIENDGDNDVVLTTMCEGIKVFINNGAGTFSYNITIWELMETTYAAFGDFNNDGLLDIAATLFANFNARVYLCTNTSPNVTYSTAHLEGLYANVSYGICAEDFNNDGYCDLVIASDTFGLKAYLGNGCKGPNTTWWTPASVKSPAKGSQIEYGDINKDGKYDLILASPYSGIHLYEGDGKGNFTDVAGLPFPTEGEWYGATICDYDSDGDLDAVICGWGTGIRFFRCDYPVPETSSYLFVLIAILPVALKIILYAPFINKPSASRVVVVPRVIRKHSAK